MTLRKTASKEKLPVQIGDVSSSLTANRLIEMLREAAADGGGGKFTPRLYDLIDLYRSDKGPDKLHRELVAAVKTILSKSLQTFDADMAFHFRKLLRDTELIDGSLEVRSAIKTYIDGRLQGGGVNVLNFAVGILRIARAPAKSAAEAWLPTLRGLMQRAPSWLVLDVLLETKGLVPEDQYSVHDLSDDIRKLLGRAEFEREIERRRAQLAKQWQMTQQQLENMIPKPVNLSSIGAAASKEYESRGGEFNAVANSVGKGLNSKIISMDESRKKFAGRG